MTCRWVFPCVLASVLMLRLQALSSFRSRSGLRASAGIKRDESAAGGLVLCQVSDGRCSRTYHGTKHSGWLSLVIQVLRFAGGRSTDSVPRVGQFTLRGRLLDGRLL
ncbi:hypothetical protein FB45DRAFT_924271 [Roridomyces roridus]|uniref:Secreted protein n=1 Tax=Roridomyces roridus TaxID=1738132 RepID=A0AAD7BLP8_9AGAR|nr:hypothetical protein FB45DRAFT_924271 [Roridomyces roridus]